MAKFEFARYLDLKGEVAALLVLVLIAGLRFGGDALMELGRAPPVEVAVEVPGRMDVNDLSTKAHTLRASTSSQRQEMLFELMEGRIAALIVPSTEKTSTYTVHVADVGVWSTSLQIDLMPVLFRMNGLASSVPLEVLERLASAPSYSVEVHEVAAGRPSGKTVRFAVIALMVILVLSVLSALNVIVHGMAGEKSGKICEMVLSAIPVAVWVDGKLIAATLHGLKAVLIYSAYGAVAAVVMGLVGSAEVVELAQYVPWAVMIAVICVTGVLFWCCAFAMICAMLPTAHSPVRNALLLIPMTALMLVISGFNEPGNHFFIFLSYLPLTSMFAMPALIVQGQTSLLGVAGSLVALLGGCWMFRSLAIRAFRTSALNRNTSLGIVEMLRRVWDGMHGRHST